MWEKEKLLVMSNFSFSHIVFKRLILQTCKNQGLFGKGLKKKEASGGGGGGFESAARRKKEINNNQKVKGKKVCKWKDGDELFDMTLVISIKMSASAVFT